MATLKEALATAAKEPQSERSQKLRAGILAGKMDEIAAREGVDLTSFKNRTIEKEKSGPLANIMSTLAPNLTKTVKTIADVAPDIAQKGVEIMANKTPEEMDKLYEEAEKQKVFEEQKKKYTTREIPEGIMGLPERIIKGGVEGFKEGMEESEERQTDIRRSNARKKDAGELGITDLQNSETAMIRRVTSPIAGALSGAAEPVVGPIADTAGSVASFLTPDFIENPTKEKVGELVQKVSGWWEGLDEDTRSKIENEAGFLGELAEIGGAAFGAGPAKKTVMKAAEGLVDTAKKTTKVMKNKVESVKDKIVKPKSVEQITGRIVQGDIDDQAKSLRALSDIDTTDVKTYPELGSRLDERSRELLKKVDSELDKDKTLRTLDELKKVETVGGEAVETNFVQKALDHLQETYEKIEEPLSAKRIKQLREKAIKEGLTSKEINTIAREYGTEIGRKAFDKKGDALTSVNAQAFENIRKGVKDKARELMPDETVKALDGKVSDIISTRKLVERMEEAANKLEQKINDSGLIERFARLAGKTVDAATFGSVRGLLTSFLPSNIGNKVLNSLDLQERLPSLLQKFEKAYSAKTKEETMKILTELMTKDLMIAD